MTEGDPVFMYVPMAAEESKGEARREFEKRLTAEHTERHGRKRGKIDPQMTQMAADKRKEK